VHRWSVLIISQRDATQSSLFITLQVHSTCFGCEPHPSSGVHKTVTTTSGTVQLPPSNVAKLRHVAGRKLHSTGGCSYSFVYSWFYILCLWFRASPIYINNCPTRCNTKQSIYYSASSLYMFRVSITTIISTQNCNYSLRYCAATSFQGGQAWPRCREVAAQYRRL